MQITEAKQFLGTQCAVTYRNRRGDPVTRTMHIHDITFVPLYGAYVMGDVEDVSLEQITDINALR